MFLASPADSQEEVRSAAVAKDADHERAHDADDRSFGAPLVRGTDGQTDAAVVDSGPKISQQAVKTPGPYPWKV